jgi:hypothetical protein
MAATTTVLRQTTNRDCCVTVKHRHKYSYKTWLIYKNLFTFYVLKREICDLTSQVIWMYNFRFNNWQGKIWLIHARNDIEFPVHKQNNIVVNL